MSFLKNLKERLESALMVPAILVYLLYIGARNQMNQAYYAKEEAKKIKESGGTADLQALAEKYHTSVDWIKEQQKGDAPPKTTYSPGYTREAEQANWSGGSQQVIIGESSKGSEAIGLKPGVYSGSASVSDPTRNLVSSGSSSGGSGGGTSGTSVSQSQAEQMVNLVSGTQLRPADELETVTEYIGEGGVRRQISPSLSSGTTETKTPVLTSTGFQFDERFQPVSTVTTRPGPLKATAPALKSATPGTSSYWSLVRQAGLPSVRATPTRQTKSEAEVTTLARKVAEQNAQVSNYLQESALTRDTSKEKGLQLKSEQLSAFVKKELPFGYGQNIVLFPDKKELTAEEKKLVNVGVVKEKLSPLITGATTAPLYTSTASQAPVKTEEKGESWLYKLYKKSPLFDLYQGGKVLYDVNVATKKYEAGDIKGAKEVAAQGKQDIKTFWMEPTKTKKPGELETVTEYIGEGGVKKTLTPATTLPVGFQPEKEEYLMELQANALSNRQENLLKEREKIEKERNEKIIENQNIQAEFTKRKQGLDLTDKNAVDAYNADVVAANQKMSSNIDSIQKAATEFNTKAEKLKGDVRLYNLGTQYYNIKVGQLQTEAAKPKKEMTAAEYAKLSPYEKQKIDLEKWQRAAQTRSERLDEIFRWGPLKGYGTTPPEEREKSFLKEVGEFSRSMVKFPAQIYTEYPEQLLLTGAGAAVTYSGLHDPEYRKELAYEVKKDTEELPLKILNTYDLTTGEGWANVAKTAIMIRQIKAGAQRANVKNTVTPKDPSTLGTGSKITSLTKGGIRTAVEKGSFVNKGGTKVNYQLVTKTNLKTGVTDYTYTIKNLKGNNLWSKSGTVKQTVQIEPLKNVAIQKGAPIDRTATSQLTRTTQIDKLKPLYEKGKISLIEQRAAPSTKSPQYIRTLQTTTRGAGRLQGGGRTLPQSQVSQISRIQPGTQGKIIETDIGKVTVKATPTQKLSDILRQMGASKRAQLGGTQPIPGPSDQFDFIGWPGRGQVTPLAPRITTPTGTVAPAAPRISARGMFGVTASELPGYSARTLPAYLGLPSTLYGPIEGYTGKTRSLIESGAIANVEASSLVSPEIGTVSWYTPTPIPTPIATTEAGTGGAEIPLVEPTALAGYDYTLPEYGQMPTPIPTPIVPGRWGQGTGTGKRTQGVAEWTVVNPIRNLWREQFGAPVMPTTNIRQFVRRRTPLTFWGRATQNSRNILKRVQPLQATKAKQTGFSAEKLKQVTGGTSAFAQKLKSFL